MTPLSWGRAAAVYLDRRILAVLFLGFSSGLPLALTGATLSVWLATGGVSRTAIGLFALVGLPYTVKFVWAPLIDRLRLPVLTRRLGRRRGWAIASQTALMLALLGLSTTDPVGGLGAMAGFALLVAFCSASQDIVLDAYRVELLEETRQGAGAAAMVLGYRIGMLASGAGALYLAGSLPWAQVYQAMAALVLVGMATILLTREPAVRGTPESLAEERRVAAGWARRTGLAGWQAELLAWVYGAIVAPFVQFMTRPAWPLILLFMAVYKLGDVFAGVMAAPFYVELGFSTIEIAAVTKVFGLAATIVGGLLGGIVVSRLGVLRSLIVCGLLQMLSNLTFVMLALAGHDLRALAVTVAVENLCGGMATSAFVAYLSSLCNAAYTATQYALLTSFTGLDRDLLGASGGWFADRLGWAPYFLFSTAMALPGLLVLLHLARLARRGDGVRPAPAVAPRPAAD